MRITLLAVFVVLLALSSTVGWAKAGMQESLLLTAVCGSQSCTWSSSVTSAGTTVNSNTWSLMSGSNELATVNPKLNGALWGSPLSYGFTGDPVLPFTFSIQNNQSTPVTFDLVTQLTGLSIANAVCTTSAGITVTSLLGGVATATGQFTSGDIYQATTNGGTVFASLLPTISTVPPLTTNTENGQFPVSGVSPSGTTVTSMQSEFKFTLTPGDLASGTSRFECDPSVPEPMSMVLGLLGLSSIAGFRRLRRR